MRILVTGAGGMLGSDVCRAADAAGDELTGLTRSELDITDVNAVTRAVADARPDAVINCAAWTKVDAAEGHEMQATAVPHSITPGEHGITYLVYGTREPGDNVYYPTLGQVLLRGLGVTIPATQD